ncbi:hypothetical protein [Nostoc sp.]
MTKLDGTRGSVTVSMPDFYRFTNIRLFVGNNLIDLLAIRSRKR